MRMDRMLGWGGLLPFALLTGAVVTDVGGRSDLAIEIFRGYACLILSFIGGVIWGHGLEHGHGRFFALSMVPFAAAWVALLVSIHPALVLLLVAFPAAYAVHHSAARAGLIDADFLRMRKLLTLTVSLCLAICILAY